MLTGSKVFDVEADSEANAEDGTSQPDESSDRPDGWIFQGWMAYHVLRPCADKDHQSALFEVGDWVKNKRSAGGSDNGTGGHKDKRRVLADQTNVTRINSMSHGIPLGASKKDLVIISHS